MIRRAVLIAMLVLTAAGICAAAEQPAPLYAVKFYDFYAESIPVRMAYRDVPATKDANGKVVLLMHGEDFSGYYWEKTIQVLASHGFRVVAPDQLGFGASSRPNIHYSFNGMAENMQRLLAYLNVSSVYVVGHSMGGIEAVRFALQYPALVKGLVLEDPLGLEDYRTFLPHIPVENEFRIELHADYDSFLDRQTTYYVKWKPEYEAYVRDAARLLDTGEFPEAAMAAALIFETIYQQPVVYELPRIAVPTLLIIGQEDHPVIGMVLAPKEKARRPMPGMPGMTEEPSTAEGHVSEAYLKQFGDYQELAKKAQQAIKDSTLIQLPGVGHIPHIEAPEKFNDALISFLSH